MKKMSIFDSQDYDTEARAEKFIALEKRYEKSPLLDSWQAPVDWYTLMDWVEDNRALMRQLLELL